LGLERLCLLLLLAALALACGESAPPVAGSGSGTDAGTGSVSVFVTDAPSDDFEAINVSVTRIELLGGPRGKAVIFEGFETFDLLALRDVSAPFASAEDVPAGMYSKIRLTLADLELVEADGEGGYRTYHPHLPGNGKLDLLPREPFEVRDDEMQTLQLDLDADRSIHIVETGNKRRFNFRPVIFVEILENAFEGKLVRLHGLMRDIDADTGSFDLCHVERPRPWLIELGRHARSHAEMADGLGGGRDEAGAPLEDTGAGDRDDIPEDRLSLRRCLDVHMLDDGALFDENGEPIRLGSVEEGQRATVFGHITHTSDRRHLRLLGELVLLGEPGTFTRLRGVVDSELDDSDRFDLAIAPGQGFSEDSVLAVQLFPTSKLFSRSGMALSRDHIELGLGAAATGVIVLSSMDPDMIRTAVLVLAVEKPDIGKLRGEITRIALDARKIGIEDEESGETVCVDVPVHAAIFLIDEDGSQSERIRLQDLEIGDTTDVYGRPGDDECFIAHVIIAFPPGEDPDGGDGE
jgi:hypothetical protein